MYRVSMLSALSIYLFQVLNSLIGYKDAVVRSIACSFRKQQS